MSICSKPSGSKKVFRPSEPISLVFERKLDVDSGRYAVSSVTVEKGAAAGVGAAIRGIDRTFTSMANWKGKSSDEAHISHVTQVAQAVKQGLHLKIEESFENNFEKKSGSSTANAFRVTYE